VAGGWPSLAVVDEQHARDRPGIVHAVTKFLVDNGCTIVESEQHTDRGGC
jgi:formyltetrahydrofolate hydrolase